MFSFYISMLFFAFATAVGETAAFAVVVVVVVVLAHNRAPFNIIWNCIGIDYKILAHWKKIVIYR